MFKLHVNVEIPLTAVHLESIDLSKERKFLYKERKHMAPMLQDKGGGALCAGNAVALLVFGPVMP